jgi:hypothetical protein
MGCHKIYFVIKRFKTSMKNRTIGYRIIQYVLGFLVNDCIPMDTYMTRDPCENDMFTNSNKAFINFNNFLNKRVMRFATLNCQQARKRIWADHEFTLIRRGNELQSNKYCIIFCTEDPTKMVIEQNKPAVRKQLPMLLYHHLLNHQYTLQSIQLLQI